MDLFYTIGYIHRSLTQGGAVSKKLFIFAQLSEARAFIQRTQAVAHSDTLNIYTEGNVPCRYTCEHGTIILSGMGIHYAQMAVAKYADLADEVWNLGLAGSLRGEHPIGQLFEIMSIGKYVALDEDLDASSKASLKFATPDLRLDNHGGRLISSDFPIHNSSHKQRLSAQWDLVDMEGYGIAFAAHSLGKKCRMWKILSDFAMPGGQELIRKHKAALSEKIADTICEKL